MRNSELDFNFRFECLARVPRRIKRHLQYIPHVNSRRKRGKSSSFDDPDFTVVLVHPRLPLLWKATVESILGLI